MVTEWRMLPFWSLCHLNLIEMCGAYIKIEFFWNLYTSSYLLVPKNIKELTNVANVMKNTKIFVYNLVKNRFYFGFSANQMP